MFRIFLKLALSIFLLFAFILAVSNSLLSLLLFTWSGAIFATSWLLYGYLSLKRKRYKELFRGQEKTGADSTKAGIFALVSSLALLMFLYNFYTKETLHFKANDLLLEAKQL